MKGPALKETIITQTVCGLLILVMTLALSARPAWAQTGAGTIAGTVSDLSGAVVPGANLTLTNRETGAVRSQVTSAAGAFHFGAIPRGQYTLDVELSGFKKWSGKLELQVGQTAKVDPVLEVGQLQNVVEVSGAAAPITLESSDVSDVKDYQRIRQLPLNGRAISSLFDLTPGVEGGGNARVSGMKVGSLEITLDGISMVDRFGGGIARMQPGLDTIQEFRIETVGSDARFSRPATVTLATRSGTNQFHGTTFETHRNNQGGLLAHRREEAAGATKPHLVRNEFGVSAGGPLFLGKLYDGHDKTFWFGAYEGLIERSTRFADDRVPTAAMWGGDLSNIVDANGRPTTIYDPLTTDANGVRQPFPGNIIPGNRISAFAKVMQGLTGAPTNSLNPHLGNNYQRFYPVKQDRDNLTVKVDHTLTDKDRLSVRWTRSVSNGATEGGVFGNPIDASAGFGTSRLDAVVNNVSINHTRTFSSTLLNELLVGAHRSYKSSGTLADFEDWPKTLGVPNPFGAHGWPTMYAVSGDAEFGWDADNRKDEALTGGVLENNTTWYRGKHTVQFGGKLRMEWNNVRELQQAQGSHDFAGPWTSLYSPADDDVVPFTGSGFADVLLGMPSFLSNQYNRGFFYFRQNEAGLYFTDQWRVNSRLTLNLGLRWDMWTPYREKYNRLVVPDINSVFDKFEVVTPGDNRIQDLPGIPPAVLESWSRRGLSYTTAQAAGMPDGLFRADNNNFGPRLGAAFQISKKTVVRGAYGEYFWTMPLSQILQSSRNNAPLNLRFTTDVYGKNANFNYPLVSRPAAVDIIPATTVDTEGIVEISDRPSLATVWDARNWKDGRSQTWHATVEHQFPYATAVRLSYIGSHGRDLEQQFELNTREAEYNYVARTGVAPPANRDLLRRNKDWTFIGINRTGYSNTHSGQVEVERRFSGGVAFQWFYTFTRSQTTSDSGGFESGNTGINSGAGGGRVPENHQILGAPDLSYDARLRLVYFNSTTIPPHRIRYNGIVDLPFGKGKRFATSSSVLDHVIGGWQVAAIGDWRSGFWSSIDTSRYVFGDPTLDPDQRLLMTIFGHRQRLWFRGDFNPASATNVSGGDLLTLVPTDPNQRIVRQLGPNFNNQLPQQLANGITRNTPVGELYNPGRRAFFQGPGAWNVDLAVYKNLQIWENVRARLSADFFNVFNHPNDVAPNSTTGLQDLSRQSNNPRIIQLSLRVDW
jgi:carboxypeptidase family protein